MTSSWQGTETPTNYSIDLGEGHAQYQIDYSGYKARIITAGEVAIITNNTSWDELTAIKGFYLDSNDSTPNDACYYDKTTGISNINECKYGWLYDRTYNECTNYGCLNNSNVATYGYWTITPNATISAYIVGFLQANIALGSVDESHGGPGIRPVIEVLRSKLN